MVHADLLLLLKSGSYEGQNYVRAAVAQTRTGLRLLVRDILLSGDAQKNASAVEEVLYAALPLHLRRSVDVVAVPPFVSQDLARDYDYLQAAYARLLEDAAMRQDGVVVVEMEEARAIGEEMDLTNPGAAVERELPLYLMGEYRNNAGKLGRRTDVRIELRRGQQTLERAEGKDLEPEHVAGFLVQNANRMLGAFSGKQALAADPDAEARQLADRATMFSRIGNWQEALDLTEACLLLRPDDPSLHRDAVTAIGAILWAIPRTEGPDPNLRTDAEVALRHYRRGLDHLERFLRYAKVQAVRDR